MSQAHSKKVTKHTINPNAATRKKVVTNESNSKKKEEKKETFFSLAGATCKRFYTKTIKPVFDSIKGGASKVSDKIKARYESEKETYKSIGFWRYCMDVVGRVALKVAKLGVVVTIAFLLEEAALTYGGFSILDPMSLAIALGIGLLAVIVGSVMTQKDEGSKVSANKVGSHLMEAMAAA